MDFRFVAYDPQAGTKLYQLPRANSVNIGDTFGTRGTLELTYSAKAINARDLPTFLEVQAEVTFDQGDTWAPAGPSLLRLSGSHEDTDQAGMRTLQFVGREWVLGKARVGNGDLELIDGKRPFYRASPGQILRTLILEAQDRGAADGIEIGNFTAAKDSSGKAWAKVATIYYSPGLPIGSVLENLVEQGMCDYRMDGRTIELFDPETTMGRDLTTGDNPVRVHGAVTEAPVKYTLEDLANSALLMGDEGFELEVDNPTAPDDYGRLEVTIEQGGVSDSGTARLMVDEALQRGSREVREITRSQSAAGAAFLPFRDYRVGDYVQVHTGGEWERYRVREIQLARDGQEWTIHTVINDRLQELLLKLAKRTNGIVNGSKGSGGDGTRPTPPEKPGIEPAAPEGLVIDQQVYLDRQGIARGQVTAGWGAVAESTKGQAVEIGGYELWWRRNETQETWTRVAVTDGSTSVNHSPVVLTDTFGTAMEYQWRVRAIAEASTRPGPFSDVVTLTMTQDTEPPNTPSLPTVTTDLRIITVDVDGLDEFGESMPVDFDHTRIYFAPAEDMVGAEQVGTLTQPGSWNSGSMTPDVPVWVAVSAVDHVGNESAMTPAQSVTPKKLVDDDSIRDAVDGIDGKIDDAVRDLNDAIDNIVIDANGTTTYWMPTAPDETTDPQPKTGDLWFDTSTAGKNKLHRFDGASWVSAADERIDTIGQAQDDLEADVDRVRTSVDGKNAVIQSTSTPPNQYDGAVGDIWEIMSSMGSGGRSVSRWRWNGTVWVSNLIGDTVLGNVDAAKIGTGYLDADRIKAGTITADKVLIGTAGNYVINGTFDAGISGWGVPDFGALVEGAGENGSNAVVITPESSGAYSLNSDSWPVPGPGKVRVSARIMVSQTLTSSGQVQVYLRSISKSGGLTYSGMNVPALTANTWTTVSAQLDVTDVAVACNAQVSVRSSFPVGVTAYVSSVSARDAISATLIEDGAITTDKILANAITAGKIAALAIEADHISANAITADKIKAGAIDGKLITGARIRTAASGRRTELDVEGLKSYDSSGNTVLTTQTSDGSIDMRGYLRQVSKGVEIEVGSNYRGGFPSIQWSDSTPWSYPPGVTYHQVAGNTSKRETFIQGPGSEDGNAFLGLQERGDEFDLRIWKGTGSSRKDWRVNASLTDNDMRVGSSTGGSYLYFNSDGDARVQSERNASLSAGPAWFRANKSGSAWMQNDAGAYVILQDDGDATFTAKGNAFLDTEGGDLYIRRRNSAGTKTYSDMRLDSTGIHLVPKSGKSNWFHGVIGNKLSDPVVTMVVGNGGEVGIYGSTRRIKEQIETVDSTTYEDNLLSVPVSSWIAKRDVARSQELAEFRAENPMCPIPEHLAGAPDVPQRNMGMIAEDLHEAGMTNLVGYDAYGRPETIIRESVGMMLIPIIRRLRDRVDVLETKLGENNAA